jgi:hypothetical protein
VHWILAADGIEEKVFKIVKSKESYTISHFQRDRLEFTKEVPTLFALHQYDHDA